MHLPLWTLLLAPPAALAAARSSPRDIQAALAACLQDGAVAVDAKGTDAWTADATVFNARLPYTPVAVAAPTTVAQVQAAVRCGVQAGVKVTPKCGGHSWANFGFGGEDGHLVVEMDRMHDVKLDNATGVATVQGGSRLGHVAYELYSLGKRAISHGTCPGVGSGGHVLHGGYGMSSHYKGLALDWLISAKVVLANGTLVSASATENPDLFWAIKGAGSSFGIVVEFQFNTFEPPAVLTPFMCSLSWNNETAAMNGLRAVQDWVQDGMPAEVNARVFITKQGVNLEGLFYGDKAALTTALAPLLKTLNAKIKVSLPGDWLAQLSYFSMGIGLDQTETYPMSKQQDNFYSSSLYTDKLTDSQLSAFTKYWFSTAKAIKRNWYVQIDLHGGSTSAITNHEASSSSYAHRDRLLMYQFYDPVDIGQTYPADGFSFVDGFVASLTQSMRGVGMYFNYPSPNLNQTAAQQMYWGDNLPRLQGIKARYDPNEVFFFPQAVRPANM